jgi:hypothetical protein
VVARGQGRAGASRRGLRDEAPFIPSGSGSDSGSGRGGGRFSGSGRVSSLIRRCVYLSQEGILTCGRVITVRVARKAIYQV